MLTGIVTPFIGDRRFGFIRLQLNGGRVRKVLIVALARKLLIAFWKYVTAGVVLEGAETTAA